MDGVSTLNAVVGFLNTFHILMEFKFHPCSPHLRRGLLVVVFFTIVSANANDKTRTHMIRYTCQSPGDRIAARLKVQSTDVAPPTSIHI